MTNKKIGNDFEKQLCEMLSIHNFWAYNCPQNADGQPADVIAARNGKGYLIDCKVCTKKGFDLSRMEENQDLSMELWKECGNGEGWFAILLGGIVYMIPHFTIKALCADRSSLSPQEVFTYGKPFDKWVAKCR